MSPLASSKYEKNVLRYSVAAAILLHVSVVLFLLLGGTAESENRYKPLAVVEFARFDPEGGQPGGGESESTEPEPAVAPEPEPVTPLEPEPIVEPEPEPEPEVLPKVVESVSEKANPAPPPPPPKEKPKEKPKPKPKAAPAAAKKGDDASPGPAAPGGGPGDGQGGIGGGTGSGNPNAFKAYTAAIQRKLNRYKKYPPGARSRKVEGVVTVNFTVNRQGEVTSSRLVKSSGHSELDEEVMALLKRVSPFTPMPKEMTQTSINLTAPIHFALR